MSEVHIFSRSEFNQAEWFAAERGKTDHEQAEMDMNCIRGAMVSDLKKHYFKETTTQGDVIALLGEPGGIVERSGLNCLQYILGMCSGIGIDYDHLNVCFKNDSFTKANTEQH